VADDLKVYLDHLIPRESLRYERSTENMGRRPSQQLTADLRMKDLMRDQSPVIDVLRKPDFQRATWAWTPEDCLSLLESVTNNQVIPSIIMWSSPENDLKYILDGGHRVSVVLAWLNDDWGEHLPDNDYGDEAREREIKTAAREIRRLVDAKIGKISNYQDAFEEFRGVVSAGKAPKVEMHPKRFEQAEFYNNLMFGNVGFPLQWVTGNYEIAERSFLKINKSGQKLSPWEELLVENRNSSFARAVMSISNTATARHYWPEHISDNVSNKEELEQKIKTIRQGVIDLHSSIFEPLFHTPIRTLQQPLLVADEYHKPYYLAEFLTVIEGGRGQATETTILMSRDRNAAPEDIVVSGATLIEHVREALEHIQGPSQRSLALIPTLYFYTDAGRYVRSLLYGFFYWLLSGESDDILQRKRVFSAHRRAFEDVLLVDKEHIVSGISRKTGSGPEVTNQTARYFQGLLELLVKHDDAVTSAQFSADYAALTDRLTEKRTRSTRSSEVTSRLFTEKQKSTTALRILFESTPHCGICGGLFDPHGDVQHDHITPASLGGQTTLDNQRMVHPFCNNHSNRTIIEGLRSKTHLLALPTFVDPFDQTLARQLSFLDDPAFASWGLPNSFMMAE